jgi:flagellar biosynthetic protein FliQ
MTVSMVCDIIRQALETTFWVALPLLAIGFAAGVLVSLFQIVTSIQDASVGSVPRLAAFLIGLVVLLPWMLNRMVAYTTALLGDFTRYAR